MNRNELRVLDALWRLRYEDRRDEGWTTLRDLVRYEKLERDRLGFRMAAGRVHPALIRLERRGWVECERRHVPPPSYPWKYVYRITEEGHRRRAEERAGPRSTQACAPFPERTAPTEGTP